MLFDEVCAKRKNWQEMDVTLWPTRKFCLHWKSISFYYLFMLLNSVKYQISSDLLFNVFSWSLIICFLQLSFIFLLTHLLPSTPNLVLRCLLPSLLDVLQGLYWFPLVIANSVTIVSFQSIYTFGGICVTQMPGGTHICGTILRGIPALIFIVFHRTW